MERGIELLRAGWEVVVGSRRCAGAGYAVSQSATRRLGSAAFRAFASKLTGPVSDTQCGFKLFAGPVAKVLFESTTLNGFTFDVELLARALEADFQMIELPIRWSDCDGSISSRGRRPPVVQRVADRAPDAQDDSHRHPPVSWRSPSGRYWSSPIGGVATIPMPVTTTRS